MRSGLDSFVWWIFIKCIDECLLDFIKTMVTVMEFYQLIDKSQSMVLISRKTKHEGENFSDCFASLLFQTSMVWR